MLRIAWTTCSRSNGPYPVAAMQGSLAQIQLPEILQFLSMGKGSGLLTLSRGGLEIVLHVRNGRIVNSSSIERQRRLGELLVQRGILRRSTLAEVLKLQRSVESDKRLGQILVDRDIVKEQTIREVLRLQIEEEIWNLFSWEDGEFKFEHVDASKIGEPLVEIDIEPLILEGTRRQDEWKKIQKMFPNDGVVLTVKKLDDSFKRDIKLTPTEWRVLSQVNGHFSIRAVINRAAMGRFETYSILYNCLRKGLVIIKPPSTALRPVEMPAAEAPKPVIEDVSSVRKAGAGIFSIFSGAARKVTGSGEPMDFATPAGALAAFITAAVEQFYASKDKHGTDADRYFLDKLWNDIMMLYTRADLISVENNRVNAEKLESFFAAFEFSPHILEPFEDSMEALFSLLDGAFRQFAMRLGERQATRIVRDLLGQLGPRIRLRYGAPFNLEERVSSALKLAA